jgi:hypothetical protein
LTFLQHAPELYSSQSGLCEPKRFEAEHGSNYSLDEPMILLDNSVQVLALPDLNTLVFISVTPIP